MRQYKSHLTAITRNKLSTPMSYLHDNNLILGRKLDYGCGKGQDADILDMYKYDPYYFKTSLNNVSFKTITCHYVLNVIQSNEDIYDCLAKIQSLLTQDGTAYITVRRDIKEEIVSKRDTYQRPVYLNLETVNKQSHFETYKLDQNTKLENLKIS